MTGHTGERLVVWRCKGCGSIGTFPGRCMNLSLGAHPNGGRERVEEVEVIPVTAPNVLSVDEAKEVAGYLEGSGREDIQKLWFRLKSWAIKAAEPLPGSGGGVS